MSCPLLEVDDLRVAYSTRKGTLEAVRGVSFAIDVGERVGLVGESGSGKSALALALLSVLPGNGRVTAGAVRLRARDLAALEREELRSLRGSEISIVFQDPMTSLNPVFTVGQLLDEVQRAHGVTSTAVRQARAVELLTHLGIPDPTARLDAYPHELSGGMRQRVMLAMALANEPALLIADEPTTALDVTVEAQIAELLRDATEERNMALLFISHDLRLVSELCHKVLVMYAGKIVEAGAVADVFTRPCHPYTRALLDSLPDPARPGERLKTIPGAPPGLLDLPVGCSFQDRCPACMQRCLMAEPPLRDLEGPGQVACWLAADAAVVTERSRVAG